MDDTIFLGAGFAFVASILIALSYRTHSRSAGYWGTFFVIIAIILIIFGFSISSKTGWLSLAAAVIAYAIGNWIQNLSDE